MAKQKMTRLTAVLAGALLIGAIAACDNDHHRITGPQVVQYTLATVDSNPLPYQISQSGDGTVTTTLTDMVLSIFEDRTWHSTGHQTVTTSGVPSVQLLSTGGTYLPGDETTTFRDSAGALVWAGLVSERVDSLTAADGKLWVFER
jgi:hypothetical protein